MQRYSKKRELILDNLKARKDHPTAEELYASLKASDVSLPTIYRNLAALSQTGAVRRLKTASGTDRFDADTSPHSHFECTACGRMIDAAPTVTVAFDAGALGGLTVDSYSLTLYGVCNDCNHTRSQHNQKGELQ